MAYRGRDTRSRLALWTLAVLGSVVLLVAAAGVAMLMSLMLLAGAALTGWHLTRRGSVTRSGGMTVPVVLASRRRA
ncbi:hypothetical protein [Micromonospora sp. DT229]|uniref:hypothetical protein n=1 Tax=Micromonospora sp. DT229 TaxID=3393430 RepID=UPI003CECA854